jgi:hypothetical protein
MTDLRGLAFGLPRRLWLVEIGIFVAALAGLAASTLERRLPHEARLTPRPVPEGVGADA